MSETIFALSSAPGRAGVAVIRVSGQMAKSCISGLAGVQNLEPRRATLCHLRERDGEVIDQGLVLWFPGPASFTGEDMAEFHVHGGRATVAALLEALLHCRECRPAEAGEFTRRAVLNGKLDLTQAEALADLINSETLEQRRQALAQYGGSIAKIYGNWRQRLIGGLARVEAVIDFGEEVSLDLPAIVLEMSVITKEIQHHIQDGRIGEIIRDGLSLTVIGPPNTGKSSLINALAQRDVAIVAETAGTTRDVVEVRLDLGGLAVVIADTAGLREASDPIEREGVRRALTRATASDMVLLLLDASDPTRVPPDEMASSADLTVWNKCDLAPVVSGLAVSAKTGEGLGTLLAEIQSRIAAKLERAREAPVLTRMRHRHALEQALCSLRRVQECQETELLAEDIRLALRAIGRITGQVDVEELLDIVFRDFCIGK